MIAAPDELVQLMGPADERVLLAFVEAYGGNRVYIPRTVTPECNLARLLGEPAALVLSRQFGGEYIQVPNCRAWRARIYSAQGASNAEIARRLCATDSVVARWTRADREPRQPNLNPRRRGRSIPPRGGMTSAG